MNKFRCLFLLIYTYSTTVVEAENFLENKNGHLMGVSNYKGVKYHHYTLLQSHIKDGSGAIELISYGYHNALHTSSFKLEKEKHYMLGFYMKTLGSKRGQNIMFKLSGEGEMVEMNWNVSKENEWEEIILPYRANKTGLYHLSVFTYRYSLSKNGKYVQKLAKNLDRSTKVFVDDFFVYESRNVESLELSSHKIAFNSPVVKVDTLGNWFIQKEGKWIDFFPKFLYQDWSKDFIDNTKKYKEYGFTGYIDINSIQKLKDALNYGLNYNGIQVNDMDMKNPRDKTKLLIKKIIKEIEVEKLPSDSIVLYQYDNEMERLCDYGHKREVAAWIDKHDAPKGYEKRVRVINMLNGMAEGVARNLQDYYDIVSTYITQNESSRLEYVNPVNTFGLLQKTDKLHTPTSIMQLQCNYQELFIPYLFKGIISGAKGLSFWRAGKNLPKTCHEHYENNYWASATKDVFEKIDKMLPIIREPLETSWSAKVDDSVHVALGKREHQGKEFIILSNFTKKDRDVHVHVNGQKGKRVFDFFTQKHLSDIKEDTFSITIGHFNNGYLVLELKE